jgi:serine/threonine-protein kinase
MSPEQVRGERVGPASDLYSLGVVLYEMLTGELPYQGDDPIATAMKHLDEPPRNPQEMNSAVPEELDALVVKLLAKDPEDRYVSAASLSEDLRRVRDELPPLAARLEDGTTKQMSRDTGKAHPAPTAAPGRRVSDPPASLGRRGTLVVSLVAFLLGVVLLVSLAWALGWGTSNQATPDEVVAKRVEVPGVVGLSQDKAQKRLEKEGLKLGSQDEAPSGTVAENAVIEQDPVARTQVNRGSAVNVVISTGPPQEPTPQASPSATATASPAAASPAAGEAAEEAAKEAEKRREEAQKQAEEKREEAQERAEERRKEQEKKGKQ